MSRSQTRARNRRARLDEASTEKERIRSEFQDEFQEAFIRLCSELISPKRAELTGKLVKLIYRIADSNIELWPFENLFYASDICNKLSVEEIAEFQAIFAVAVAPHLAWHRVRLDGDSEEAIH